GALVVGAAPHTAAPTVFSPMVMPTPDQMGLHAWALAPATVWTQMVGAVSGYTASGALARLAQIDPPAENAVWLSAFLSMDLSNTSCRPSCWAAWRKPVWASSKLAVLARSMPTFVTCRTFFMYWARSAPCALYVM